MQVPVSAVDMGSSPEENTPDTGSKKRAASRQISRDDDPDVEEDVVPLQTGTFLKASDAVLANRRIVKVRRTSSVGGGGGVGAAPNPFASVRLVPPVVPAAPAVTEEEVAAPEAESVVPAPAPTSAVSETVVSETVVATEEKVDEIEIPSKEANQSTADAYVEVKEDVVPATDVPPGEEKKLGLGVGVGEEFKVVAAKTGGGENGEASAGSVVVSAKPISSSSETFQQLSSAKNAFSGAFGTGFSSSTFSFGSSTQASTGFSSFGSTSWTGSGFATGLFGSTSSTTGGGGATTAFPSLTSFFGNNTNGSSTTPFQLFGSQGSAAAAAATPTPAFGNPNNTGGLGLQEVLSETGEEKEKPVFAADASLFEFIGGEWKERGRGEIRLNLPEDRDRKPRLVMRSKGNLRLLLNANLFPDMKPTKMDNRGVTFVCANSAGDAKAGLTTYALRMKDSAMAGDFLASIQIHKGQVNTEPRTPGSSPKAVDRSGGGGGGGSEQLGEEIETGVKCNTAEV
jgi:Ran-binding protein 3